MLFKKEAAGALVSGRMFFLGRSVSCATLQDGGSFLQLESRAVDMAISKSSA